MTRSEIMGGEEQETRHHRQLTARHVELLASVYGMAPGEVDVAARQRRQCRNGGWGSAVGVTLLQVNRQRVARICFGVTFVVAAVSVGWQFVQDLMGVWDDPGEVSPPVSVRAWRFFSYFTTQAALLVVVTSFTLARRVGRDGRGWRVARLDALSGITITGLVHWFLLHPLDDFHGWLW